MSKDKTPVSRKRKRKVVRLAIVSFMIIALVAAGIVFLPDLIGAESDTGPTIVKNTAVVAVGDISRSLSASAPIVTSERKTYKPESAGEILEILLTDGEYAAAGETVMVLDMSSTDESILSLEDEIAQKNDTIDDKNSQIEDIMAEIGDRRESIIELLADIETINTEIDVNEALRSELSVVSTMEGTILDIKVDEGDYVSSGAVLATVTDLTSYEMEMTFPAAILDSEIESVKVVYLSNEFDAEIVSIAGYTYKNQSNTELVDVIVSFETDIIFEKTSGMSGRIVASGLSFNSTAEGIPYNQNTVNITAVVSGEVTEIYVIEKQSVKSGEIIALLEGGTIDSKTENLLMQIDSIESQIEGINEQISSYYENIESLGEDIDDIKSDIAEIEEEIEVVRASYEDAYIKADFSGIVTEMNVSVGDPVTTNTALFTLVSMDLTGMVLAIDELDISEVMEGLEASIVIDALRETEDKPVEGIVSKIALEGDSQGGVTTYDVSIALLGTPEGFRLGMNATATIYTSRSEDTLYLPIEAITVQNGRSFVYLVDDTVEGAPVFEAQPSNVPDSGTIDDGLTGTVGTGGGGGRGSQDPSTMTDEELAAFEAKLADKGMTLDDYLAQQESDSTETENGTIEDSSSELNDYYNGTRIVEVTTGIYNALYIEILSGLEAGDEVVLPPVYVSSSTAAAPDSGIIGLPGIPGTGTGGGGGGGGRSSGSLTGGE